MGPEFTEIPARHPDTTRRANGRHAGGAPTDPGGPGATPREANGSVAETGTTVVGIAVGDAVVFAADRRASVGGGRFVTSKRVQKVERVHPTAAVALSGAVGHIQQFVRSLRAESSLYADRRGSPPSMTALSTLAGTVLGSAGLHVSPLLGGVDEAGAHLFDLDGGGGVLESPYAAGGSGMQVAYGVLEGQYDDGLSPAAAREVAARAVESASERDTASGNGLAVATVTSEGVDVREAEAASQVDAGATDDPTDLAGAGDGGGR